MSELRALWRALIGPPPWIVEMHRQRLRLAELQNEMEQQKHYIMTVVSAAQKMRDAVEPKVSSGTRG